MPGKAGACNSPFSARFGKSGGHAGASFSWSRQYTGSMGPPVGKMAGDAGALGIEGGAPPIEQEITFKEKGAKSAAQSITAVSTSVHMLSAGISRYLSTMIRLQQMTLALTQTTWSLADAMRTYNRLGQQNYALDTRRAELQVKLAQRSLLITQRTGRQLDVEMAKTDVDVAAREVIRAKWQEIDKEREAKRGVTAATMQLQILNKSVNLMFIQLYAQTISMTIATLAYAAALRKAAVAQAAVAGTSIGMMGMMGPVGLVGAALLTLGIGAYTIHQAHKNRPQAAQPLAQAQTQVGDVRMVQRSGPATVHAGEMIMGGGGSGMSSTTNNHNNVSVNIHITGSSTGGGNINRQSERFQLQQTVLGFQRPKGL